MTAFVWSTVVYGPLTSVIYLLGPISQKFLLADACEEKFHTAFHFRELTLAPF
jgi:hypothetical protein